jgi:hypothetical protein
MDPVQNKVTKYVSLSEKLEEYWPRVAAWFAERS